MQGDELAMGSPPAQHFANSWMSQYSHTTRGDASLCARYMDDVLINIKMDEIGKQKFHQLPVYIILLSPQ